MLLYSNIDNNIAEGRTSGMQLLSRFRFLLFPLGKPPALPGDYKSLTVPEK